MSCRSAAGYAPFIWRRWGRATWRCWDRSIRTVRCREHAGRREIHRQVAGGRADDHRRRRCRDAKQLEADELLTQNRTPRLRVTAAVTLTPLRGTASPPPGRDAIRAPMPTAYCPSGWEPVGSSCGLTARRRAARPSSPRRFSTAPAALRRRRRGGADVTGPDEVVSDLQPYWTQGTGRSRPTPTATRRTGGSWRRWRRCSCGKKATQPVLIIHHTVVDESLSADVAKLRRGDYEVDGKKVPALDVRVTQFDRPCCLLGCRVRPDAESRCGREHRPDRLGPQVRHPVVDAQRFDGDAVASAVVHSAGGHPPDGRTRISRSPTSSDRSTAHRCRRHCGRSRSSRLPSTACRNGVGSLEPERWPISVVLGANPLTVAPDRIGAIPVVNTYLGGKSTAK